MTSEIHFSIWVNQNCKRTNKLPIKWLVRFSQLQKFVSCKREKFRMALGAGYDNLLEDQYRVPLLAKILHALPHLNITFHRTNNTFRPTDEIYLEVSHWKRWKIDRNNFLKKIFRVWEFWDQFRQPPSSSPSFVYCCTWCQDAATGSRDQRTQLRVWKLP